MMEWITPNLQKEMRIEPSENGFTSNEIALIFLQHYIKNSDAGPNSEWKLMLMDNHGSHNTPEFITLANDNHILPYPLLPHLTHCMQPLDVGIFGVYKHWHDKALQEAVAKGDLEYGVRSFLRDLKGIRDKTLTKKNQQSAFRESGMFPPNTKQCLDMLKKFNPPTKLAKPQEKIQDLPRLPRTPKKPVDVELGIKEWETKIVPLLSSPSRPCFESFVRGTKDVVNDANLDKLQLSIHQSRFREELQRKATKGRTVKKFGGLTIEDAQKIVAQKEKELKEKEDRQQQRIRDKLWREERDLKYREGVNARAEERSRKKRVKELLKAKEPIPPELLVPIPDPEAIWKADQQTLKAAIQEDQEDQDSEVEFIIDLAGDPSVRPHSDESAIDPSLRDPSYIDWDEDFVRFPDELMEKFDLSKDRGEGESEDEEEETNSDDENEVYDSNRGFSCYRKRC